MLIPNAIVFDEKFKQAFFKLLKREHPALIALRLFKVSKVIDEQTKDVFKVRDSLVTRYCVKGETGSPKLEGGMPVFETEENKVKFFEEMNELLGETFEIPLDKKIKLSDEWVISPDDIAFLEPFLDI